MTDKAVKKILLIDDEESGHDLIRMKIAAFVSGPWELDWANTYNAGLKKMCTGRYAVCLLDNQLREERDGLSLLREARAMHNYTPVIFMTGDARPELDEEALEAGAMDFLVKSEFTAQLLERAVRYAIKMGQMLDQLRQQATFDELTKLNNRREFDRLMLDEWQRSVRFRHPFALVILDIDFFKRVNDTHGHQVGDEVLRHVASLLAGQVRIVDKLARYGGEEFALVMVEINRAEAREVVDRLRALLAETPYVSPEKNLTIEVTLSAGVATMPEDADTVEQLIAAADEALYTAKRLGRNRVVTTKNRALHAAW
jgi:diguanylate cyclase (GGDEF)-like protein